jgi:hypothetical protein
MPLDQSRTVKTQGQLVAELAEFREQIDVIGPVIEKMESRYPENIIARAVILALKNRGYKIVKDEGA